MNLYTALLWIALLASAGGGTRQTPIAQKLPEGNNAWVLDLVTSGGFDGMGIGTFSVNSTGTLTCSATRHKCPNKLSATALNSVSEKVKAATAVSWGLPTDRSLCSDCVTVRLQLGMRQPDGSIKTFIASWDAASFGVPEQLHVLFNALTDFGK